MSGIAKTIVLGFAACANGARIVVDQAADSKAGEICMVNGPQGSGLAAAVPFAKGKCFVGCRKFIFGDSENNKLFSKLFEATPLDKGKCGCKTTIAVKLVGDDGAIEWELPPGYRNEPCNQQKCWKSYKGAYDVGRDHSMQLFSANNYNIKCSPDDGSRQEGFTMGISVFHHVRQAAKEATQDNNVVADSGGSNNVAVDNRVKQETVEDTDEPEELLVQDDTTLEEVLDHTFALGTTSGDNIKKAAEIINNEVNVVEDPWKGWNAYLTAVGRACNVGIEDMEEMQKVQDWSLNPERLVNRNLCEADKEKCGDTLSEYPGLQADGCHDDECKDAIDKISRFLVAFSFCKTLD